VTNESLTIITNIQQSDPKMYKMQDDFFLTILFLNLYYENIYNRNRHGRLNHNFL